MVPAPSAAADVEQNAGGWIVAMGQGSFGLVDEKLSKFRWWFDTQVRFLDVTDGFAQTLFRPGLGFAFSKQGAVWAGYTYFINSPPSGSDLWEQQAWQQFTWSEPSGRFTRFWRTRLEERFVENQSDVGVRLRQLFRTTIPIREDSRFSIVGWDEIFFHLRDTDWGSNAGLDQNRFFIGFAWRMDHNAHSTMELGYMGQYIDASTNPNVFNHIASLTLHFR